jgi:hypothetical protein
MRMKTRGRPRVTSAVSVAPLLLALALSGCGGTETAKPASGKGALEGDATLIASAQVVSDAVGGCAKTDASVATRAPSLTRIASSPSKPERSRS